jgi:hypothetical protein
LAWVLCLTADGAQQERPAGDGLAVMIGITGDGLRNDCGALQLNRSMIVTFAVAGQTSPVRESLTSSTKTDDCRALSQSCPKGVTA